MRRADVRYQDCSTLLSLDFYGDALMATLERLNKGVFDCLLKIKRLMYSPLTYAPTDPATESSGVKLPKLAVLRFLGDIVNWRTFWEQCCISIHDRSN